MKTHRHELIAATLMLITTLAFFAPAQQTYAATDGYVDLEAQVLNELNRYRMAAGLTPLVAEGSLFATADLRARESAVKFSHTRADGSVWWTANLLSYGENLAVGHESAAGVVSAWMNSPSHMLNIMTSGYRICGVGVQRIGGNLYIVAEFGY